MLGRSLSRIADTGCNLSGNYHQRNRTRLTLQTSCSHHGPVDRKLWRIIRTVQWSGADVSRAVILPMTTATQRLEANVGSAGSALMYNFTGCYKFSESHCRIAFWVYSGLDFSVLVHIPGDVRVSRRCGQVSPKGETASTGPAFGSHGARYDWSCRQLERYKYRFRGS